MEDRTHTVASPYEHYQSAEALIEEGKKVVSAISLQANWRGHELDGTTVYKNYTRQMDELGKKVMGIWAQATAEAILANYTGTIPTPPPVEIPETP